MLLPSVIDHQVARLKQSCNYTLPWLLPKCLPSMVDTLARALQLDGPGPEPNPTLPSFESGPGRLPQYVRCEACDPHGSKQVGEHRLI